MTGFRLSSEPFIFLYTIIFTINYTVLPQLVLEKCCLKQNGLNKTSCKDLNHVSDEIQKVLYFVWYWQTSTSKLA